jgi:carbonic anhydrase
MQPTQTIFRERAISSPNEALERLLEGNQRFAADQPLHPNQSARHRASILYQPQPWATIWGCIDSRVAPELIFDRGFGDLYIIRTAAQSMDNVSLGSADFSVQAGVRLLLVLGHQACVAVHTSIRAFERKERAEGRIDAVVKAIKPAYNKVRNEKGDNLENVIRANIALQVERLKSSKVISNAWKLGKLKIVGAYYNLQTGKVEIIVS